MILLIQDNVEYARLLSKKLADDLNLELRVQYALTLQEGLKLLQAQKFEVVLLELSLPDSGGLETFRAIRNKFPEVPIVILTAMDDELMALQAVREGAQDYLLKGEAEGRVLPRVIRYAMERHRVKSQLLSLSFTDELTGVFNRRGFFTLAEQQLKFAARSKYELLLLMADLDKFKDINDRYGHVEGDKALKACADVLKHTFRSSDIIGRLGGDEFAILALGTNTQWILPILKRLFENLSELNRRAEIPYRLAMTVGFSAFHPENLQSVNELLQSADKILYENKMKKQILTSFHPPN